MTAPTFAYLANTLSGTSVPDGLAERYGPEATPYQLLRALTPIAELKEKGTFFTSVDMADTLWANVLDTLPPGAIVVDPACGAGDLLFPPTRQLRGSGHPATIRINDTDDRFARIARSRLAAAIGATNHVSLESSSDDFLVDQSLLLDATHVVLNPPFVNVAVDEVWASGKVNAAALFVTRALSAMRTGSMLLAVLPDVLRSGSRYEAWRKAIADLGAVVEVAALGQFDAETDVDVFKLVIIVGSARQDVAWTPQQANVNRLGDYCEVRVGPVVPHRDKEEGPDVQFITARSLSAGATLRRRFPGRLESGPFVLVNRTSRPGENPRIRARLHLDSAPAAIENHLIIVKPRQESGVDCEDILRVLADPRAVDFLDNRIRCRHLTVRAVREIPWEML